ncbi:MAG: cytochrome c3 family protein [Gemmataceae bacterium]
MPQIFHRSFNTLSLVSIYGAVFILAVAGWLLALAVRSSYATNAGNAREQPIPFSHQHHVNELGIDCRYCHTSVEDSHFAGIPPTKTCMNCHSQIWVGSKMLEPVRESYRTDQSIPWARVHKLGDFCYFNHSIHVKKGIGCVTCHGRVDQMPLIWQEKSLLMEWCLDCHRQPAQHVRPRDQIYNMTWSYADARDENGKPYASQAELGKKLVDEYQIKSKITCNACHR